MICSFQKCEISSALSCKETKTKHTLKKPYCFSKVAQWAWHISSHLRFSIGTLMASLRGVSREVLLSAVHTYCTLIYNAYLVIRYASCDCNPSDFLSSASLCFLSPLYLLFFLSFFVPFTQVFKNIFLHSLCSVFTSYCFSFFLVSSTSTFHPRTATCLHPPPSS